VNPETGTIRLNAEEPEELVETCALDLAERDGMTLEQVGKLLRVSKEWIRRIEDDAMKKLEGVLSALSQ
jgi:DNA-directed RNA polymerase sigma subunit (sigma70/sigma32)